LASSYYCHGDDRAVLDLTESRSKAFLLCLQHFSTDAQSCYQDD
jgi:hypothetical protein